MPSVVDTAITHHKEYFPQSSDVSVFVSPGRINIIGEHIDYNGGTVFPIAIDKHIYICASRNNDGIMRFASYQQHEQGEIAISNIHLPNIRDVAKHKWWVYPLGACALSDIHFESGFDISFYSTLPVGAGMSSSAAITVGTLYALCALHGKKMKNIDVALKAQQVEWNFAGVQCGVMDQMAIINGRKNNGLLLNTKTMEFQYIPIDSNAIHFVLVNSGVKHNLRESGYNERRSECQGALTLLQKAGFAINCLCDCTIDELATIKDILPITEYKRVFHVISENHRVHEFAQEIQKYNLAKAGRLLYQSHHSLSNYFEVSIPLIDAMVEWVSEIDGVYGSRLMGGGFGGCTVTMIALYAVEHFKKTIAERFEKKEGRTPDIYECTIDDGVHQLV